MLWPSVTSFRWMQMIIKEVCACTSSFHVHHLLIQCINGNPMITPPIINSTHEYFSLAPLAASSLKIGYTRRGLRAIFFLNSITCPGAGISSAGYLSCFVTSLTYGS